VKPLAVHRRFKLVEGFTEAIAQLILTDFNAHWMRVSVAKTSIFNDVEAVGVIIERTRITENMKNTHDAISDHERPSA
jgi:dihydroneopterin aldolase